MEYQDTCAAVHFWVAEVEDLIGSVRCKLPLLSLELNIGSFERQPGEPSPLRRVAPQPLSQQLQTGSSKRKLPVNNLGRL